MNPYVYEKKTLHINRHRRKSDNTQKDSDTKEISKDRRHEKVIDGIILEDWERRQNDESNYSGFEKRTGVDRRNDKDRRKKPL